jgi:hypothetical protein
MASATARRRLQCRSAATGDSLDPWQRQPPAGGEPPLQLLTGLAAAGTTDSTVRYTPEGGRWEKRGAWRPFSI